MLLTRNEVANARAQHPNVALVVVSGIAVSTAGSSPAATGGTPRVFDPWTLEDDGLTALAFSYRVPSSV